MSPFNPPSRLFAGYIFDCDGTLADSMPLHFEAWKHALRRGGARFEFTWEQFTSRAGMTLEQTVAELSAEYGAHLDASRIACWQRQHFDAHLHTLAPIQPVAEFAKQIARERPVSVATGNHRQATQRVLQVIGLDGLFPVIVTSEDVPRGKPAPDTFLEAARRMGVPPAQCVVFEDSPLGLTAAHAAHMEAIWVRAEKPAGV